MIWLRDVFRISERRACGLLQFARSSHRYKSVKKEDPVLRRRLRELAASRQRFGYRRLWVLLRREGWRVNHDSDWIRALGIQPSPRPERGKALDKRLDDKRIERLWRREGLKVPQRQPKRGRLWLADGSCVRRRAEHKDHVWSYDFVLERTHDGRAIRALVLVDEFTRECLAARVARGLRSEDVIDTLADLFLQRGTPKYLRSDRTSARHLFGNPAAEPIELGRRHPVQHGAVADLEPAHPSPRPPPHPS